MIGARNERKISGDSVIGSTGALAPNFFKTREQYRYCRVWDVMQKISNCVKCRGVSFAIGQTGNWQTVTTLPNILKQFNPRFVQNFTRRWKNSSRTSLYHHGSNSNFTWGGIEIQSEDRLKTNFNNILSQTAGLLEAQRMWEGRTILAPTWTLLVLELIASTSFNKQRKLLLYMYNCICISYTYIVNLASPGANSVNLIQQAA